MASKQHHDIAAIIGAYLMRAREHGTFTFDMRDEIADMAASDIIDLLAGNICAKSVTRCQFDPTGACIMHQ